MKYGLVFEELARRVAEAVWRLEPGGCQPEWYRGDPVLRELDGIARLPEVTHLLMVTVDTKLDKIKADVQKLNAAERHERKQSPVIKKWLITERQLNAEHISHARSHGVEIIPLAQFRDRFFNGRDYIAKRRNAAFGSSRNLRDGSISVPDDEYVELPMVGRVLGVGSTEQPSPVTLEKLVEELTSGRAVTILGPFGAGKSLTAREVFFRMAKEHLKSGGMVPVAINLREHWGALYADEILERHARSIGFVPKEGLTVAWRAGLVCLILDGFDEMASQTIGKPSDKNFMRQVRYEALRATRELIQHAPSGAGILICGRDHYFDKTDEMIFALGLTARPVRLVRVDEFTEDQAASFLRKYAATDKLPDWLPRKPLILGYLAHQNLLDAILKIDASRGFGFAWDSFLNLVCEREAQHNRASMDPLAIRHVLERLSCVARGTPNGDGPISSVDLAEAYTKETGGVPGEGVLMQLQRLPGLTPREQDPTARSFVDEDLLHSLQGSALARAILENKYDITDRRWRSSLGSGAIRMAAYLLTRNRFDTGGMVAMATRALREGGERLAQFAADCIAIGIEITGEKGLDCKDMTLVDALFHSLDLEDKVLSNLTLLSCGIDELTVGAGLTKSSITFQQCVIDKIVGVPSKDGLPSEKFLVCDFGEFDDVSTNAAIWRLNVPPRLKALLSVLRKLYLQAGGGRELAALKRGLPGGGGVHSDIDEVLKLLEKEGMIFRGDETVHPVRRHTSRVREILSTGSMSKDPLVHAALAEKK
jgi:hypothetical protein